MKLRNLTDRGKAYAKLRQVVPDHTDLEVMVGDKTVKVVKFTLFHPLGKIGTVLQIKHLRELARLLFLISLINIYITPLSPPDLPVLPPKTTHQNKLFLCWGIRVFPSHFAVLT
jgi:hypothetical protein